MKKYLLTALFLLISIKTYSMTIVLKNGTEIYGNFKSVEDDELFFDRYTTLYIIDMDVIMKVIENNQEIDFMNISTKRFRKIQWNSYIECIDITSDNFNNPEILNKIHINNIYESKTYNVSLLNIKFNSKRIPVTIIALGLAYDFNEDYKDLKKATKNFKKLGLDTDELKTLNEL